MDILSQRYETLVMLISQYPDFNWGLEESKNITSAIQQIIPNQTKKLSQDEIQKLIDTYMYFKNKNSNDDSQAEQDFSNYIKLNELFHNFTPQDIAETLKTYVIDRQNIGN